MDFETKANESKKRTNIISGITIDWQFAQQLFPSVLNELTRDTPEFRTICANLSKFCTNIENDIKELKSMIPQFND